MGDEDDYARLYLYQGSVAHMVNSDGLTTRRAHSRIALCGMAPDYPWTWYGTGTQAEYEKAAVLPTCRRCVAVEEQRSTP